LGGRKPKGSPDDMFHDANDRWSMARCNSIQSDDEEEQFSCVHSPFLPLPRQLLHLYDCRDSSKVLLDIYLTSVCFSGDFANFDIFDDPSTPYSTFNFKYSHEAFERLSKLTEFNTLSNIEAIKKAMIETIAKKRTTPPKMPIQPKAHQGHPMFYLFSFSLQTLPFFVPESLIFYLLSEHH
jgi:hypothetical protein